MSRQLPSDVQRQVEEGIAMLRQGGIVAYPTDTVYGLGASMSLPQAVERIYQVKQRPPEMALPLLVASTTQMAGLAAPMPPTARKLAGSFLPGALTIVMTAAPTLPETIIAAGTTVAARIPDHPIPLALIEGIGVPLVGTSANVSGRPSPLTADEVRDQLGDEVDLVIDDGQRCPGRESTIVDVTGKNPKILREGAISLEDLQRVCGPIPVQKGD